jgi:hypothetical protein
MPKAWGLDLSSRPRCRALLATVVALAVAPGCAAMDKRDDANLLRGSVDRVVAQRTLTGTLRATATVKRTKVGVPSRSPAALAPAVSESVRIDLTRYRSSIDAPAAAGGAIPVVLFSEDIVYQRRIGQAGEGTTQGRPWVKLPFRSLHDRRQEVFGTGYGYPFALNPAYLFDLLAGTLTGSVDRRGRVEVGGEATTRYDLNVGLDKAFLDAPDRRREGIEAYAAVSALSLGRAASASVWMGADGLPRRIKVTLSQRRDVDERIDITYVFDVASYGAPVDIHLPKRKEIATVDSMGKVLAAISSATANVDTSAPLVAPTSTVPVVGVAP